MTAKTRLLLYILLLVAVIACWQYRYVYPGSLADNLAISSLSLFFTVAIVDNLILSDRKLRLRSLNMAKSKWVSTLISMFVFRFANQIGMKVDNNLLVLELTDQELEEFTNKVFISKEYQDYINKIYKGGEPAIAVLEKLNQRFKKDRLQLDEALKTVQPYVDPTIEGQVSDIYTKLSVLVAVPLDILKFTNKPKMKKAAEVSGDVSKQLDVLWKDIILGRSLPDHDLAFEDELRRQYIRLIEIHKLSYLNKLHFDL